MGSLLEDRLIASVVPRFQHTPGTVLLIEPYGSGLINDTFKLSIGCAKHENVIVSYVLQRINHHVFTRPIEVMSNIERVTQFLAEKIRQRGGDATRETLSLIPTKPDEPQKYFVVDHSGMYWRMYNFIAGATA